jgi:tetratricopeptide (TPR) repeat protein
VLWRVFLLFFCGLAAANAAQPATVLVLQFHNNSQYSDLNWVGESVAETLRAEFSAANEIVLDRDSRAEGMRRLTLRPDADFTKATLIRLGQTLDVDYLCYGSYDVQLPAGDKELKDSSIRLTGRFLDLRKMRQGPELSEAGKLSDLSRYEEHLAWQSLKYLQPGTNLQYEQFVTPQKLVRLDAEESYVRGLLSTNPDQQQKWFTQAALLDSNFSGPAFELGKLFLARKEYSKAISWFQHISATDPRYPDARFKMGISAYGAGDYTLAGKYFQEVIKTFPLSEVYNNLGAAENQLGLPVAMDDFRRALEADPKDAIYIFNMGSALVRNGSFDEAVKRLQPLVDHNPDDAEARDLLDRARRHESPAPGAKAEVPNRLKQNFNETAFRQLKAMLQSKGSE